MRIFVILTAFSLLAAPMWAQTSQFPLTAKVVSSDTEKVPSGSSTSTTTAMQGTIWQHPQHSTTIHYRDEITVTAEIENQIYRLASPRLLSPADYPASIDGGTVRLLTKDGHSKDKTLKLRILSIANKP